MKPGLRRRAALGLGAAAAGATLAFAWRAGKPGAPVPHVPPIAPAPVLLGIAALRRTENPAPLAPAVLVDAAGTEFGLDAFAGKGLVINLWATWCVPCVAELPALAALARLVAGEDILVLPLSSDRGGAAVVEAFYSSHGIAGLPVWLDPKGAAARAWGARGIPTTLIVDRQGRERGRLEGGADWASDAAVEAIRGLVR